MTRSSPARCTLVGPRRHDAAWAWRVVPLRAGSPPRTRGGLRRPIRPQPTSLPRRRSCRRPSLSRRCCCRPASRCPSWPTSRPWRRRRSARRSGRGGESQALVGRGTGRPAGETAGEAAAEIAHRQAQRRPLRPDQGERPHFRRLAQETEVAIVITGMEEGYIEPCGCAGLDRMKGGMGRRCTFIEGLRKQGWPLVVLDVGGLARGFGRQAEMKFQTTVEGKRKMGYDAVAFGTTDLRLPAGLLVSVRRRGRTRACSFRPTSGCLASTPTSPRRAASSRPAE